MTLRHEHQAVYSRQEVAEIAEQQELIKRISDIMTRTINALRGDPPALVAWSWHDLPDRAAAMRAALIAAMEIVQEERTRLALADSRAFRIVLKRIAELDAIIAQADAALGSEG